MSDTNSPLEQSFHLPHVPDALAHEPQVLNRTDEVNEIWSAISRTNPVLRDVISKEARQLEPVDLEQRSRTIGSILHILGIISKSTQVEILNKKFSTDLYIDELHTVPEAS